MDTQKVTLAALRERLLVPDDCRCVYVSGSLVRGWGNLSSDVDIYVIAEATWTSPSAQLVHVALEPDALPVEVLYVDGRRWDIEYWLPSQVDQMLEKVAPAAIEGSQSAGKLLTTDEIDFLDRLGYAVPVLGERWLRQHQQLVRDSAIAAVLTARALNNADLYTEDAVGQLEAGDTASAVLSVKLAFGSSVDALLASRGEIAQNPKWRARKFALVEPDILSFERYWEIETMRTFQSEDPAAWVREVLEVCQDISIEVAVA